MSASPASVRWSDGILRWTWNCPDCWFSTGYDSEAEAAASLAAHLERHRVWVGAAEQETHE